MEDKLSKSYIERIEIKGLWGRFDVDWTLHSDVNILVGENGTGKSTILLGLYTILNNSYIAQKAALNNLQIIVDYKVNNVSHSFESSICENVYSTPDILTGYAKFANDFPDSNKFQVNHISTFDKDLYDKNEWDKKNKPFIKTHLDRELDGLIDNYLNYQLNQTKKIINGKQNAETVFAQRRYLLDTINHLFKTTNKRVDEDENRIAFLLEDGQKLSVFDLSSGEKQLLIILLMVLCQDEKPSILLLDEPEISMHLRWQYELIEIIRTLNPNCQVIIVTHSPSLFSHGWRNKIFWMEDICKPHKTVSV